MTENGQHSMQDHARVVIIGAGIVGCSAAYHLTCMGWRDIVVIDQGPLFETGGSSSHAPGLAFQTNFSKMMTELAKYSVGLYCNLKLDGLPCFYPVGGMEVAYSSERWRDLKRKHGVARSWGLEAELLDPRQAKERLPLLNSNVICGAYYVPNDGIAKAVRAAEAMAGAAANCGASFYGDTSVTAIEAANGRMQAVVTSRGRIRTDTVLTCAGIWGPRIGRMAGVSIPLVAVQHQYVKTSPLAELAGETREVAHPILRHQDCAMYFRQHADCYGIGSYEHEPLLVDVDDIASQGRSNAMPSVLPFTEQDFHIAHKAARELLPALEHAELVYKINGMFSFTPDAMPLLGESLELRGFWVAEAVWITHAGGAGKVVAEWMVEGSPGIDVREADINRFHPHAHTPYYVRCRGAQQYREVYDIIHPLQQMNHPRNLRLSPFHSRLVEQRAVFLEGAGWERPQWLESNQSLLENQNWPSRSGWEARCWSPIQGAEHRATRERVALYDLTPFVKIEVSGRGALRLLQSICTNQMDQPIGKVVYTSMLNHRAGIVCDLTVTRLDADRFLVLTGAGMGMHDLAWIRRQSPCDGSVQVQDITSKYCTIGLWGPKARRVLQEVSSDDLSNTAFPYFTAKHIAIGAVPALALRVSYVGELGWEIYTLTEYGLRVWDALWEAGKPHGIIVGGGGAFDSLRLEKGYRLWGADIHSEYNSYEAGLGFTVKLDKGEFLGRDAVLRVREQGVKRKLCCITLDEPDAMVLGKEPILSYDRVLGYVTSTNFGYCVGKHIVYCYLPVEYAVEGSALEIEYFGKRYSATVVREPLYDPQNMKLKA